MTERERPGCGERPGSVLPHDVPDASGAVMRAVKAGA
jgi:hypothetical protein